MAEAWTVRRVVAWIQGDFERRGISSPRLEADLIICHALGVKRISLYTDLDRPLIERELSEIRALVERRRAHEPMAYILGEREFYSRAFEVNRDVLIPRPDTETLAELVIEALKQSPEPGPVAELCVGSGALIVTLAAQFSGLSCVATDISAAALAVAARNAARHSVAERIDFRAGDLFAALPEGARYAVIAANPPYIRRADLATLDADVRDFEPRIALDGGDDGLDFYRRIAAGARAFLLPAGWLAVEVGYDQAEAVAALFGAAGFEDVRSTRDLSGIPRVVSGRAPRAD
jgi:release factor glutamine methyltransferase